MIDRDEMLQSKAASPLTRTYQTPAWAARVARDEIAVEHDQNTRGDTHQVDQAADGRVTCRCRRSSFAHAMSTTCASPGHAKDRLASIRSVPGT